MPRMPEGADPQGLTVVARRVLLDAMEALAAHRDAVTVVGAQAVHLRSVEVDLQVAAYTSDADFSLDPDILASAPLLEALMAGAGFSRRDAHQPGLWKRAERVGGKVHDIGVDLLVPAEFVARGRRSAHMPPHDRSAARRTEGLEAAAVDADLMTVSSLDPGADDRAMEIRVAGPAALLIAKAYKIHDRVAAPERDRLVDKDASDVIRLMMATDPDDARERVATLLACPRTTAVARTGLEYLRALFGAARTTGTSMAVRALRGSVDEQAVRRLAPAFVAALLESGRMPR